MADTPSHELTGNKPRRQRCHNDTANVQKWCSYLQQQKCVKHQMILLQQQTDSDYSSLLKYAGCGKRKDIQPVITPLQQFLKLLFWKIIWETWPYLGVLKK